MDALLLIPDEQIRHTVEDVFRRCGYEIRVAKGARELVELFSSRIPRAVVIGDLGSPDDGCRLCQRLRRLRGGDAPIILLAHGSSEGVSVQRAIEAGADDVIVRATEADILEARLRVAELRSAEERFRLIVEGAPTGLLLIDASGQILLASQVAERIFGYGKGELVGALVETLIPERYRAEHPKFRNQFVMNPTQRLMGIGRNLAGLRKDGTEFPVEVGLSPLHTPGGMQIVCNVVDITHRRRLEEQFLQSQKMESLGRLAGGLAHDFNNLLSVILTNCDMLLGGAGDPRSRRSDVEGIRTAAQRAAALTSQLLAIGRKQRLDPKVIDLNTTLMGLQEILQRLVGEDVEMTFATAPNLGCVRADQNQIEQVLVNLTVNARDAMPEGGELIFETGNVDLDEEYCRLHAESEPGPYVMIAVTDTGTGIDAPTMNRIFEPFYTTKDVGKGTGLGLSTALGIVKQSGGHMWAYSEPGKGSTFRIYLPRIDESASRRGEPAEIRESPNIGGTVLVVEDADLVRASARRILESKGYEVLLARNGQTALAVIRDHEGPIDLMLTDCVMPKMSGEELAARARELRPELAVLFMSGYSSTAFGQTGRLSPDTPFLQKPFTVESLASKVVETILAARGTGGKRVLVIENEEDFREGVCFFLEDSGYKTFTAGSLDEGLAVLSAEEIDVVVTDLRLPGSAGRSPVDAIVAAAPGLPFIVMSGAGPAARDILARTETRAEPVAILEKPFGRDELLRAMRRASG